MWTEEAIRNVKNLHAEVVEIKRVEESPEIRALLEIIRHITRVKNYLGSFGHELQQRATRHDLSKFEFDEFYGFANLKSRLRSQKVKYDSDEYLTELSDSPIVSHFSRNSHHPEHHENGVNDMNLFDIIEMVIDWKAANESYRDLPFDEMVQVNIKRFGLSSEQAYLVRRIAEVL